MAIPCLLQQRCCTPWNFGHIGFKGSHVGTLLIMGCSHFGSRVALWVYSPESQACWFQSQSFQASCSVCPVTGSSLWEFLYGRLQMTSVGRKPSGSLDRTLYTYVQANMSQSISDGTKIHTASVSTHLLYTQFSLIKEVFNLNVIYSFHKCSKTCVAKNQIITTW